MNNRLGCLTGSGILATLLTVLIVGGVALARGGVLFSPGALNAQAGARLGNYASHAEIGGKCSACHTAFWDSATMADRCLNCHKDVAAQLQNPAMLHGVLLKGNPQMACRTCHPDHRGPDAPLTVMDIADFPHESLGYSLIAHQRKADGASFGCTDCHGKDYTHFDQAACSTCHRQIDPGFLQAHTLAYGNDCLACHDGIDTYGHGFNHGNVSFKLTGRHTQALCTACHLNEHSMADMRATSQDCYSCHAKDNPHSERLGTDCGACHSTAGWIPATFDHNLAAFKLVGKHIGVACGDCHKNNVFRGTPMDCYSCHAKDDKHAGQFGTQCDMCHSPAGWLPANFDHNLFAFKLTGKHVNVACISCHINNVFKGTPTNCYACHAKDDHHRGRFGTSCGACHSTSGWLPATFDHSLSGFPLTGAHATITCTQCHTGGAFTALPTACVACHADPAFHAGMFGTHCASCHNTSNWNATYTGPHPTFGDQGGINHGGASCRDCHTVSLATATCTKCHDSNNPGGEGGGGGGGGDGMILPFGNSTRIAFLRNGATMNILYHPAIRRIP